MLTLDYVDWESFGAALLWYLMQELLNRSLSRLGELNFRGWGVYVSLAWFLVSELESEARVVSSLLGIGSGKPRPVRNERRKWRHTGGASMAGRLPCISRCGTGTPTSPKLVRAPGATSLCSAFTSGSNSMGAVFYNVRNIVFRLPAACSIVGSNPIEASSTCVLNVVSLTFAVTLVVVSGFKSSGLRYEFLPFAY